MNAPAQAAPTFAQVFAEITSPSGLPAATLGRVFDAILAGEWTSAQIAALLVALRMRGETPAQVAAAASAMRRAMVPVEHGLPVVLDTCGTGGDGAHTLNISTGAAVIAAACGVVVAKHGNRAVSSRSGSADVLEALGIPLDVPAARAHEVLAEAGIAFLMAPAHHPAMRHAAPTRRELGIRTLFNVLGPLANPARASHQLLGAYDDALRPLLAETLRELGLVRAWVVRGADGLDEVSPHAPTRVTELANGALRELEVTPEDFGLPRLPVEAIRGGDAAENARVLERVLGGGEHPSRDAFLLNAAAALVVAQGLEPKAATARARAALENGDAARTLERWRTAARARRPS
jgi:anthranilate phosphoribosyltransferase